MTTNPTTADASTILQSLREVAKLSINYSLHKEEWDQLEAFFADPIPPFTQCEMCNEADCCEGEWGDGSELHCLHCKKEGVIQEFTHAPTGHPYWVLSQLYDEEATQP